MTARAPSALAPAAERGTPPLAAVLAGYAGMVVLLSTVATIASTLAPRKVPLAFLSGFSPLDAWFQFDSGWYHSIAADGYWYAPGQQSPIAFFPTYPMAVRAVGSIVGNVQIAGTVLSVLAGVSAVILFTSWVWGRLPRRAAITAIALVMLYPYAFFFYGSMYSDSLFLLAALGAFTLLDRRHYWLAGAAGALATAGRPVGVAVAVGLVVRMLELQAQARAEARGHGSTSSPQAGRTTLLDGTIRPRWAEIVAAIATVRWRQIGVLAAGLGLAGWCIYLWLTFGDPLLFIEVQSAPGWSQGVGPRTWFKVLYVNTLLEGRFRFAAVLTAQAVLSVLAVLLLRRVARQFGWGYAAYSLIVIAIPIIGTRDFMGTGRYVLAAFPIFASAALVLAHSRRRWLVPAVLTIFGIGLIGATGLYAMGLPVS